MCKGVVMTLNPQQHFLALASKAYRLAVLKLTASCSGKEIHLSH